MVLRYILYLIVVLYNICMIRQICDIYMYIYIYRERERERRSEERRVGKECSS